MPFLPLDAAAAQLIVTVGPASFGLGRSLAEAGATAFRLNGSHLSPERLVEAASALRAAAPGCPLLVDLQGAKMRLGDFAARPVRAGERLTFGREPPPAGVPGSGPATLALPHAELFRSARAGETLSLDDDRLRLRVLEAGPDTLVTESLNDGRLSPRKGVNVVEHPVELEELSPADRAQVAAAGGLSGVTFAFSFMKSGVEAEWLRRLAPSAPVVGKVERAEACQALDGIASRVEAIWICRGDLGAQLGAAGLARFVARLRPREVRVPVLMAGQVLQHLAEHAAPTRSEVCHLFDLLERGYAGIVLSDETALGVDPVGATATAAALLRGLAD